MLDLRFLIAIAMAGTAWAGPRKPKPVPTDGTAAPVAPPEPAALPDWDGPFPVDGALVPLGGTPLGLPSASAQTCNACHTESHDQWAASAHRTQPHLPLVQEQAHALQAPQCLRCHQPLDVQHPSMPSAEASLAPQPTNPHWQPTLQVEGVTCAACHVRDGTVLTSDPLVQPPAAHANMAHAAELGDNRACASCHQLTWPGAAQPLYDTYGEWERSAQGKAGIGCTDCHGGPASQGIHAVHQPFDRALTVDLSLDASTLVRAGAPVSATLTVLNTGAGHAVPTGSPWSRTALEVTLVSPHPDAAAVPLVTHTLARTVSPEPPWSVESDTRIPAGGSLELPFEAALPAEVRAGIWSVRVVFTETHGEQMNVRWERRYPLRVE